MSREVPEGWAAKRLGDVCEIGGGVGFKEAMQGRRDLPFPFIKVSDMNDLGNEIEIRSARNYVDAEMLKAMGAKLFPVGSVVLPKVGAAALTNKRRQLTKSTAVDNNLMVWIPSKIDPSFLLHWSRTIDVASLVQTGALPSLNKTIAENIPLNLPPLQEQRRIAEILSSVDEAIAATRAVIEQTKRVKQGVQEHLLTKGIGHTRFKQTEIGEIPEGWRIGTLGSIALGLEAGVSVNSENRPKQPGEIGILKTSCVSAGIFDPDEHKTVLLGERDRVKLPVRGDRIIISRMNTPNLVGASGYVENDIGDLFLPDRLWQLSTSENARWLACLLASDQSRARLSAIATGTSGSMKNISKSKLLDLLFAIPSQAEQQEIASIMQEIDASIEADNRTLKGQIATKSALMSDLLTGRKRVTDALPIAAE